jgi:hypothetical protein
MINRVKGGQEGVVGMRIYATPRHGVGIVIA